MLRTLSLTHNGANHLAATAWHHSRILYCVFLAQEKIKFEIQNMVSTKCISLLHIIKLKKIMSGTVYIYIIRFLILCKSGQLDNIFQREKKIKVWF